MIRIIRHITATLLLVILPISAIGLNITIHKCHHRGTFRITLFDTSKNSLNNDCCSGYNNNPKTTQMSTGCQMGHKKVHTGCSMMNMSENQKMSSDNCGMQLSKVISKNNSNESKESKTAETGTNYFNAPCCSNSEYTNDISIHLYTIEIIKDNFVAPLIAYDDFQLSNFNFNKDEITVSDRQCLLKRPINFIISFIQHSTSLSVDEAEPISSVLYHIA